jgi:hypothetical protein
MSPEKFEEFMAKLRKLPPMGNAPSQNDADFWKEMDAMQIGHVVTLPEVRHAPTVQLNLFDEE